MMEIIGAAYTVLAVLMLAGLALILIAVVTLILLALMASATSPEPDLGASARREEPSESPSVDLSVDTAVAREPRARPAQGRREGRATTGQGRAVVIRRESHPGVP
jgi:hypothetical protein